MFQYCQRMVSVSAFGPDERPVIVPFERECRVPAWGELLIAFNPGEDPRMMTLCSKHYGEDLLTISPHHDLDEPWIWNIIPKMINKHRV